MQPLYWVDAFTSRAFAGNPAVVCLLDSSAAEDWMQSFAAEMNVSETAFLTAGEPRGLRWFTPVTEVDLCGHATLAAAHVLWTEDLVPPDAPIAFSTRSGILTATRDNEWIELDLPARPITTTPVSPEAIAALGVEPVFSAMSTFALVAVDTEAAVVAAAPNMTELARNRTGYIVTARSVDDIVCRVFVPGLGIDEDPVTGSAQCVLGPYWAPLLGREQFSVRQLSRRGGVLRVTLDGERARVRGPSADNRKRFRRFPITAT